MTVCLIVTSIIGMFCFQDAAPVGRCFYTPPDNAYCVIPAQELPLRASWYDPALGGVNCMDPCHLLGDGTHVDNAYGWALSCPDGWYGRWLDVQHAGSHLCLDSGGAIHPTYGRTYTNEGFVECWWITVDFLAKEPPPYAYMLLEWAARTQEG